MVKYSELFDTFVNKHYRNMVYYTMSGGINPSDADEIANIAFFRLWRKWPNRYELDEINNIKWMYNAIEYIKKEYYRKQKRKVKTEDIDEHSFYLECDNVIDQCVEHIQYQEYQNSILKKLKHSEAELYRLKFIEHLNNSEIEERLGVNNQALRTRISRLRDKLSDLLKDLKKL